MALLDIVASFDTVVVAARNDCVALVLVMVLAVGGAGVCPMTRFFDVYRCGIYEFF